MGAGISGAESGAGVLKNRFNETDLVGETSNITPKCTAKPWSRMSQNFVELVLGLGKGNLWKILISRFDIDIPSRRIFEQILKYREQIWIDSLENRSTRHILFQMQISL